ncbi:sensor histidine kinase [Paenibacillus thalictri]|uniref:histidine kinase n=1 Tax=Paenibacillus thalictri TaxID=2527873 RepID=A0A4Q9DUE5_9BACL|nr:sensor histidine kinase [Paenibacillus thalictri]TBL79976.1 sensor histidine kinase [Paenibacillus thalictri]
MTDWTQRVSQWYSNFKIKQKLFLLMVFIMTVGFSITYAALQYAYSIYDKELYEKSSQVLNLSSTGIENELKKIEGLSYTIMTDTGIQSWLPIVNEESSSYEKLKARTDLESRLVQYAGSEKYVYSIKITDLRGNQYLAGLNTPISLDKQTEFMNAADEGQGSIRWMYPDADDRALTVVRQIRSYYNLTLNKLGTITIRIKLNSIIDDVSTGNELKNGELLIAQDRKIIYPQEGNIPTLPTKITGKYGYDIEQLNGKQYFFSHIFSGYTEWTYYSLIPFDKIFEQIIWMKQVLLAAFIFGLLFVVVLSMRFARRITMPIEDLIGKMKQVQKGEFHLAETDWGSNAPISLPMDEVGQLHRTFRVMIQRIEELITENYAKQLIIKETEFKALQAQINPHFMYNTLESINWLAKVNGQPQISNMVEALGFLLRSSVRFEEPLLTVGEELEIAAHYMTIQNYRFEERLEFQMNVPEWLYDCKIPKLTVQPILENAIQHALEQMIRLCRITVSAVEQQGVLLLTVKDNGPGIQPELLDKISRGEVVTQGRGIGLKNIQERIRLSFGDAYGVEIDSAPGQGTTVTVRLPYEMRDRHVKSAARG